jgi:hypothetical protein
MRLTPWIAVLALAGCSATYQEPELTADHPASLDAPVVPLSGQAATLDLSTADPVVPSAPATNGHEGHGGATPAPSPQGQAHGEGTHAAPPRPAPNRPAGSALYVCPMHPEVTSDKPGQRCPKCGMTLVPRAEGERP